MSVFCGIRQSPSNENFIDQILNQPKLLNRAIASTKKWKEEMASNTKLQCMYIFKFNSLTFQQVCVFLD